MLCDVASMLCDVASMSCDVASMLCDVAGMQCGDVASMPCDNVALHTRKPSQRFIGMCAKGYSYENRLIASFSVVKCEIAPKMSTVSCYVSPRSQQAAMYDLLY